MIYIQSFSTDSTLDWWGITTDGASFISTCVFPTYRTLSPIHICHNCFTADRTRDNFWSQNLCNYQIWLPKIVWIWILVRFCGSRANRIVNIIWSNKSLSSSVLSFWCIFAVIIKLDREHLKMIHISFSLEKRLILFFNTKETKLWIYSGVKVY